MLQDYVCVDAICYSKRLRRYNPVTVKDWEDITQLQYKIAKI